MGITDVEWQFTPTGTAITGGGLRLRAIDLIKLGRLWLQSGRWNDQQLVSSHFVAASVTPHAKVDDGVEYCYLWWLRDFGKPATSYPAWYMSGNGGNKVAVIPSLDCLAVVASTNYGTRGMNESTDRLLNEVLIPALLADAG